MPGGTDHPAGDRFTSPKSKKSKSRRSELAKHQNSSFLAANKDNGVVRGLEELEVLFTVVKSRFVRYALLCIVVTVAWPVLLPAVLVAWPCIYMALDEENRRRFEHHLLAGVGIIILFFIFFGVPVLFLNSQPHGLERFGEKLATGEIGTIELLFHFVAFILMLVLVVYAWVVYGSVSLEVAVALKSRARFLSTHWVQELKITDKERLDVFGKRPDEPVRIADLLRVLEQYPGWKGGDLEAKSSDLDELVSSRSKSARSDPSAQTDEEFSESISPRGLTESARDRLKRLPSTHSMKRIDAVVLSSMSMMGDIMRPGDSLIIFRAKVADFLVNLFRQPLSLVVITLLAGALRTTIPRIYVMFCVEGGTFLPTNPVEKVVCLTFMLSTFLATTAWLLLFNMISHQYQHNVDQTLLVSAIASVQRRHEYMRNVLRVDPEDADHVAKARGLPFLDLTDADNTRIWWALREYAIVDSLDERVDLEVVLGVAMVYVNLMCLYLIIDIFITGKLTAFTVVASFDVTVVGAMVLYSLLGCVKVNQMLRAHTHTFLRARHSLWCPEAKVLGMEENEVMELLDMDHVHGITAGAEGPEKDAERLHTHLIEKVEHADTLQTLFGYEVTIDNVGQLLVAIACALASAFFSVQRAQQQHAATIKAAAPVVSFLARVVAEGQHHDAKPFLF
jgi:hypothetical protein